MEAKSQVFNMDCLEFLREQPDKSFDLAVERFERVCHGVQDIGGHKVEQGSLF